jgi:hypothetical protein
MAYVLKAGNIPRRLGGRSLSSRSCSAHQLPTLFSKIVIFSSLSMITSQSSLYCRISCQRTREMNGNRKVSRALASRILVVRRTRLEMGTMKGTPTMAAVLFRPTRPTDKRFIAMSPRSLSLCPQEDTDEAGLNAESKCVAGKVVRRARGIFE